MGCGEQGTLLDLISKKILGGVRIREDRVRQFRKIAIVILWMILSLGIYQCGVTVEFGGGKTHEEDSGTKNAQNGEAENASDGTAKEEVLEDTKQVQPPFDKNIRVLIQTSGFSGIYHKELLFSGTDGLVVTIGNTITEYAPNEVYTLTQKQFKKAAVIQISGKNNGKIRCPSITRSAETAYRGAMECYSAPEGIVLVNELPVEEYLYGVVPSEMPSSYPIEAQKAQAIGARTYAYYHKKSYAYPQWRAHVNDSTTFQVYLNIAETEIARQAVDETKDMVIYYQDALIQSFYYSTSGGYSGGSGVWNDAAVDDENSFLVETGDVVFAQNSAEGEQRYRDYIQYGDEMDIEYTEPWYRWDYEKSLEGEAGKAFLKKLYAMYCAQPQNIRIRSRFYSADQLVKEKGIQDIRVLNRRKSGLVTNLLIETEHFRINVRTQHSIRQALSMEGESVTKKDGTDYLLGDILPSAYFYIEKNPAQESSDNNNMQSGDTLKKITIYGAGLGHGAGMSQNGAKCLASKGFTAAEILAYYYRGDVREISE